ncbi:MAG: hypothetical protein JWO31_4304, partial [Phycisphaerales bacterium]|nr:hypothetical protein [Phycisphaerales bacterium]
MGLDWIDSVGRYALRFAAGIGSTAVAVGAVGAATLSPRTWRTPLARRALARQIVSIGAEGLPLTAAAALLTGVLVVVQADVWLRRVGQTQLFGPLMAIVVIREVGPLLINLIAIARSGGAMVVEVGNMSLAGEVAVLDALGIHRFGFLVVPRAAAMGVSILCLTFVFVCVSLASGFVVGAGLGYIPGRPAGFLFDVLDAVAPVDVVNLLIKSVAPGLITATVCCAHALTASSAPGGLSRAAALAVQRSVLALFVVSATVSA